MVTNINTREYWNERFASGDWEDRSGRAQTIAFAREIVHRLPLADDFCGTILDFGCGLGDSIPIIKERFPAAVLIGQDISDDAIKLCKDRYGSQATFLVGDASRCPQVDVIIASNVLEHLSDHLLVVKTLLSRCADLFVAVPFREELVEGGEHVNSYDVHTFDSVAVVRSVDVYYSKGWSLHGWRLWWHIHLKNVVRPLVHRRKIERGRQALYHLTAAT